MAAHFLANLGNGETARQIVSRAYDKVPAYRRFLQSRNILPDLPLADLPFTDKQAYLLDATYAELLADNYDQTFTIFRSSGSSGHGFYWPQLKDQQRATVLALQQLLEMMFGIQQRKTLAIVGLALGSWIGGDHFSWALKSLAIDSSYPFSVFSPGNHHDEIIEMMCNADPFVDQFLLFVCPSSIGHLLLKAQQAGRSLPLRKLRFVVLGEAFPEAMRTALEAAAGLAEGESVALSIYGSADTGVLGVESPVSVAIRKALQQSPELARTLGFAAPIPHLFHFVAPDTYVESVDGELCVTRWQGIPLLRYNLHDSVQLVSFRALRKTLLAMEIPPDVREIVASGGGLPDLLAISGRADQCLILCGTNLTEAMLDEAVRTPDLAGLLTGVYRARIIYEANRQRLAMQLEFTAGVPQYEGALDEVYVKLAAALGRVQPEFLDDWQNVYRQWDADPDNRIMKIEAVAWPTLSDQGAIKQRGIQR